MDLMVTRQQYDAVRNAKHLPDVLKHVLDKASKNANGHVLHLTYEEATALNELAAWNVHSDADGNVTPESQRSIIPPQYSGCVSIARTRSSNSCDSGVTLPSASLCTFHAASSFSAVASSYVRCRTWPFAFLLALSSTCLSTSGKCLALRTASYCCLVTIRSMG